MGYTAQEIKHIKIRIRQVETEELDRFYQVAVRKGDQTAIAMISEEMSIRNKAELDRNRDWFDVVKDGVLNVSSKGQYETYLERSMTDYAMRLVKEVERLRGLKGSN